MWRYVRVGLVPGDVYAHAYLVYSVGMCLHVPRTAFDVYFNNAVITAGYVVCIVCEWVWNA